MRCGEGCFRTFNDMREQTELWLQEYNQERPHKSLGQSDAQGLFVNQKTGNL